MTVIKKCFSTLLICLTCMSTFAGDRFKAAKVIVPFVAGTAGAKALSDDESFEEEMQRLNDEARAEKRAYSIILGVIGLIIAANHLRKKRSH